MFVNRYRKIRIIKVYIVELWVYMLITHLSLLTKISTALIEVLISLRTFG